jgi:hypothetical protein
MATSIQRLRYFDGEYLRSNDFTDEQSYHVAMRRRLNLALHRYGVVEGLVLQQDADSVPPSLLFFSVSPGFAIDQNGREIVVDAPYTLSTDNVLGRAGLQAGPNEVWIVYTESASGLSAPGYRLCDQPGQNTRWTEAFSVMLKPKGAAPSAGGQDPNTDLKGIRLGTVTLHNDSVNGWTITSADGLGRTYVGIRALSVISPDEIDTDPFSVAAQNVTPVATGSPLAPPGYLDVGPGVFARGNMFVEENMVLGDDFVLDNATYPKLPAPNAMPKNGNLKVKGDLFLNGAFYGFLNGSWMGLNDYILSLMPDVQTGTVTFDLSNPGTSTTGGSSPPITLTTRLTNFKNPPQFSVSVAGFTMLQNTKLNALTAGAPNSAIQVTASAVATVATANSLTFEVVWTVTPNFLTGGVNELPLTSIQISWIVIFTPGP